MASGCEQARTELVIAGPLEREIAAAKALAAELGLGNVSPEVVKLAKHTTLKLAPYPIVARIQSRASPDLAHGSAIRELMIASELALHGAPTVRPASGCEPGPYRQNGCTITLWGFVAGPPIEDEPEALAAIAALNTVHDALEQTQVDLPSFTESIDSCDMILSRRSAAPRLDMSDRLFLHRLYAKLREELEGRRLASRPLHGDTHLGNVLITDAGPVWLDLEAVCIGPLEWDVVALQPRYWSEFEGIDLELAWLLSNLRSVCVSTWCWALFDRSSEVSEAAIYHLQRLKSRSD